MFAQLSAGADPFDTVQRLSPEISTKRYEHESTQKFYTIKSFA